MKALKYGLTLVLGLSMGWGAQAFAQASGQTQEVVPNNPNTLPEVPIVGSQDVDSLDEHPQRGVPTPKAIEDMIRNKEFAKAVSEFEKFMKKANGNPCDLIYLRVTFYGNLRHVDTNAIQIEQYKAKEEQYISELEKKCPNMPEIYVIKAFLESNDGENQEILIQYLTKAIELDNEYSMGYSMRGNAYWNLGQTEKACADFKKAAQLKDQMGLMLYQQNCPEPESVE